MTRLPLTIGIALANAVYEVLKLVPTRDKVTLISRGNDFTSIDFRFLTAEIENQSPATQIVVLNHPLRNRLAYPFSMAREMFHIATSRAVVIDTYVIPVSILRHKPGLIVVQIWHALGAFKAFGQLAVGRDEGSSADLARIMRMHQNYTYVSAPSAATADIYRQCFGVDSSHIVLSGSPRVDYLLDADGQSAQRARLREKYNIPRNHQVVLFAPTFRKSSGIPVSELVSSLDTDLYTVLFRKHPLDRLTDTSESAIVVPDEREGIELLAVADHVVTDYSAIAFEAAVIGKPVYFWTFDRADYDAKRGFVLDFDREAPGPINDSAEEIARAIFAGGDTARIRAFARKFVETTTFGNSRRIAEYVLGKFVGSPEGNGPES